MFKRSLTYNEDNFRKKYVLDQIYAASLVELVHARKNWCVKKLSESGLPYLP